MHNFTRLHAVNKSRKFADGCKRKECHCKRNDSFRCNPIHMLVQKIECTSNRNLAATHADSDTAVGRPVGRQCARHEVDVKAWSGAKQAE